MTKQARVKRARGSRAITLTAEEAEQLEELAELVEKYRREAPERERQREQRLAQQRAKLEQLLAQEERIRAQEERIRAQEERIRAQEERAIKAAKLQDDFLVRLARAAKVPEKNQSAFSANVRDLLTSISWLQQRITHLPELQRLAKTAQKLAEGLGGLSDDARDYLNEAVGVTKSRKTAIALFCNTVDQLCSRIDLKTGFPVIKGIRARTMFELFLYKLYACIEAAGGKITIEKNSGSGTMVNILELLRDESPPSLVPNGLFQGELVPTTLYRRHRDWIKAHRGSASPTVLPQPIRPAAVSGP
jgi:hypothetical protein